MKRFIDWLFKHRIHRWRMVELTSKSRLVYRCRYCTKCNRWEINNRYLSYAWGGWESDSEIRFSLCKNYEDSIKADYLEAKTSWQLSMAS